MKPGPAASALEHVRFALKIRGEAGGQRARVRTSLLRFPRVDHRRVGREVAMGGLARRLDDEAAEIKVARQLARRDPLFEQSRRCALEVSENVH